MLGFFLAGPIPLRVREASVPVVNDNECVRKINAVTEKIFILPASSFCAGGEQGHDACQVRRMLLRFLTSGLKAAHNTARYLVGYFNLGNAKIEKMHHFATHISKCES